MDFLSQLLRSICFFLCVHWLGLVPRVNAYWWSLGTLSGNVNINHLSLSNQIQALSTKQQRLLDRHPYLIPPIALGARIAIMECQRQFRNEKWNCSSHSSESVFGKILDIACRETAFAYAITAAGVSFALTRACSDGSIRGCQCDASSRSIQTNEGWVYEGCDDNIEFGDKYGRRFVDGRERNRDFRATVNLHNNEAGRATVRLAMGIQCKCHGVSGSCNVKICNRRLQPFREIGNILKVRYDSASKVQVAQVTGRRKIREYNLQPVSELFKPPTRDDLVYYERSPNFCNYNLNVGTLGTSGRQCNATSHGVEGCRILCCRRGWKTHKINKVQNCNCTFYWCCEVNCNRCRVSREVSLCN